MISRIANENEIERRVAERYRQRGFDVVTHPRPEELPFDLGGFVPDLLVTKSDGERYIIEVKSASSRISIDRYRDVAEIISNHPGWRFLLVTEPGPLDELIGAGEPNPLSWKQIDMRLGQAEQLLALGDDESSFLTLWSILEAVLRKRAEETHLPLEQLQTSSVLNHLYSQGELSMEQYDTAIDLRNTRNLLVHGFQAEGVADAVVRLNVLVRELIDDWRPL